ncbi:CPBP family intramembrane metalloprotease [Thiothrix subterranea]|uniref:CPBP family intramembrane glutamic endopeptidase n=1 Tax=Thiothrix subterranea TaxID=2735563 RepID=UPI00192B4A70|nr:type II CAAX endopeptidase family protein [Thiothrix subterranea]QQZ27520.1 CPBP family intramembrane metalloprotease [Thiothrix subterranea]
MLYLNLAKQGENTWWRYLLGIITILIMWQGIGAIPLVALLQMIESDGNEATFFNAETLELEGVNPAIAFVVFIFAFLPMLLGLSLVIKFFHKRLFRSLITGALQIDWKRILQSMGIYLAIFLAINLVDIVLFPNNYKFTFQMERFLLFLPLVLLLIPIQAAAEELLFRGYIMQGLGLVMNKWLAVMLSSLLFALPHLFNPETQASPFMALSALFIMGLFLALITVREGTLELAIGVHVANNIASFLLIAPSDTFAGIPVPAVFSSTVDMFGWKPILMVILALVLFWLIVFKWFPRRQEISNV